MTAESPDLLANLLAIKEDHAQVRNLLAELHPSDIAHLLASVPGQEDRLSVWHALDTPDKADVVTELGEDIRVGLLEQTDIDELVQATTHLDLDDLTDLLQDLPERLSHIVLQSMAWQNRHQVEQALSYPEDSAGGLMDQDIVKIRADVNFDTILRYLRKLGTLPVATDKLMVVDRDDRFLGTLQVATLLTHDLETKVHTLMNHDAIAITANTPDTEVAATFQNRDLVSAPVVDAHDRILGRITIDDVVDVIQEDAGEAFMARDGLDEEDDIFSPAIKTAKRRNLWLGVHLLAALASAYIIGLFGHSIQAMIALAILMPLVASISGVAGSQTLTLTIRGMALSQVNAANSRWLLIREATVGIVNGLLWGSVIALITYLWFDNTKLSLVVVLTIALNLIIATTAGVTIPLVQKRFDIDPALAGHVVLTALTDAISFLSFLGFATIFLL